MNDLSFRERELVALGAAMGSNCVPCIEYHIPESRKAGLTDREILAAVQHADTIRQVPARKVLEAALKMLPAVDGAAGTVEAEQPGGRMAGMMSKMMGACGGLDQASGAAPSSAKKSAASPATSEKSGCC